MFCTVISADQENDTDILCLLGASAALAVSDIPFPTVLSGVRVGKKDGQFIVNPTYADRDYSTMDLIVAGTDDSIVMVEAGAEQVPESDIIDAFDFAASQIKKLNDLQRELQDAAAKEPFEWTPKLNDEELAAAVREAVGDRMRDANLVSGKEERQAALDAVKADTLEAMEARFPERADEVKSILGDIEKELVRSLVLDQKRRVDGRGYADIRDIWIDTSVLPRTHGSAVFQRGQTQALVVTTLGTSVDEQKIDALEGQTWKSYMLHYNFPPFSVGETRPMRGPGRREIGHGALAERAVAPVLPQDDEFPYTIRLVSEILESNGSSSMASVCGASLALMDAGVPIQSPVAGIAMGLISDGERTAVLTDIQGVEDHLGDMDFKVTGTRTGITALQMDNKIGGLAREVLVQALGQARDARIHILDKMDAAIPTARPDLSPHAPRISVVKIPTEKIGELIGPGGRMIKKITEETGCQIDISDDGSVKVASRDAEASKRALDVIHAVTADPEIGRDYRGVVKRVGELRCVRGDSPRAGRARSHLRARAPAGQPGGGHPQRRRRGHREGDRHRSGGQDPPQPESGARHAGELGLPPARRAKEKGPGRHRGGPGARAPVPRFYGKFADVGPRGRNRRCPAGVMVGRATHGDRVRRDPVSAPSGICVPARGDDGGCGGLRPPSRGYGQARPRNRYLGADGARARDSRWFRGPITAAERTRPQAWDRPAEFSRYDRLRLSG